MHITNADGVSVKYTMIITERKKKSRKGGESEDLPPKEKFIGFATNMPQTQLKVNLTFVLARHGPDPGEPPDPDYLPLY